MNIAIPTEVIQTFCEKHHILKLALFGSVLRDDFRPDSDIDVLVEFDPAHYPGFFRYGNMQDELTEILGRTVDLNTPLSLSRHFRQKVIDTAEVLYKRARFNAANLR